MFLKKPSFRKVVLSALYSAAFVNLYFILAYHYPDTVPTPYSVDVSSTYLNPDNFLVQFVTDTVGIVKVAVVICDDHNTLIGKNEKSILYQLRRVKVMLKSILLAEYDYVKKTYKLRQERKTLQIILFTGDENIINEIKKYLTTAFHPTYLTSVMFTFLPVSYPKGYKYWKHIWKPCLTFRLFLHHALPNLDSVLYVDTDTIFMKSVHDIHSEVYSFEERQWCAMGPDWYHHRDKQRFKYPYYGAFGLNSGVAILNLTKLREKGETYTSEISNIYWKYRNDSSFWGDQEIYNVYFHHHPDEVKELSCHSNFIAIFCIATDASCRQKKPPNSISILHGTASLFFKSEKASWFYIADEETQFTIIFSAFEKVDMKTSIVDYIEFRNALKKKLLKNEKRTHITKDFQSMCAKKFGFIKHLLG